MYLEACDYVWKDLRGCTANPSHHRVHTCPSGASIVHLGPGLGHSQLCACMCVCVRATPQPLVSHTHTHILMTDEKLRILIVRDGINFGAPSLLQMGKLRPREGKRFALGSTVTLDYLKFHCWLGPSLKNAATDPACSGPVTVTLAHIPQG